MGKVFEELDELHEAILLRDDAHAKEEFCDCLVTLFNVARAMGWDADSLADSVAQVIAKNDAKTDKTHRLDEGLQTVVRLNKATPNG